MNNYINASLMTRTLTMQIRILMYLFKIRRFRFLDSSQIPTHLAYKAMGTKFQIPTNMIAFKLLRF